MTRAAWSEPENEEIVRDYLAMLEDELRGIRVIKAAHNRALQVRLPKRSREAIERKHQNISAVLLTLGAPYVNGYKPLGNYQQSLRDVVALALGSRPDLAELATHAVEAPVLDFDDSSSRELLMVPPPEPEAEGAPRRRTYFRPPGPTKVDWLEREARNRSLGLAGELAVMGYEHRRLWTAGKRRLAEQVEHVSVTRPDGLGYDVLSFEEDGQERWIEVKTTQFGPMTPFFATRNEVEVSDEAQDRFHLYRIFGYRAKPSVYQLAGSLRATCHLDPVSYSARVA